MLKNLWIYFLQPLIVNVLCAIKHFLTFDFNEFQTDVFMRLPLIIGLGWMPFLKDLWLKWYKFTDCIQMSFLKCFTPSKTLKRIQNNILCPSMTIDAYFKYVTEDLEFRIKRVKFNLEN